MYVVCRLDGLVVTNNHVVRGNRAEAAFADGTRYDARVVGYDPGHDVALLRIATEVPLIAVKRRLRANSGGALLDSTGELVGINTLVRGSASLAIPCQVAETFVSQTLEGGSVFGVCVWSGWQSGVLCLLGYVVRTAVAAVLIALAPRRP